MLNSWGSFKTRSLAAEIFISLVYLQQQIGLDARLGLLARLQTTYSTLQNEANTLDDNQLQVAILQTQQAEKNFLLSFENYYFHQFKTHLRNVQQYTKDSNLEQNVKQNLVELLTQYGEIFQQLYAKLDERGLRSNKGLMTELQNASEQTEALFYVLQEQLESNNKDLIFSISSYKLVGIFALSLIILLILLWLTINVLGSINKVANHMLNSAAEHDHDLLSKLSARKEFDDITSAFDAINQKSIVHLNSLKETKHKLAIANLVSQSSSQAIMITDSIGTIKSVNPSFSRITGYEGSEVIGKNANILNSGEHNAEFYVERRKQLQRIGVWEGEVSSQKKNGHLYTEWLSINAIKDPDTLKPLLIRIFSDISRQKQSEEQIHKLAFYDQLTGLPNRNFFWKQLELAVKTSRTKGSQFAILMVTIDNFAQVNESLGHANGDKLLQEMAQRLRYFEDNTLTIARMGGAKFIILIPDLFSQGTNMTLADKLFEHLQGRVTVGDIDLFPKLSIGGCVYPIDGNQASSLMQNLEAACLQAKLKGHGRLQLYDAQMNAHSLRYLQMSNLLRDALKKDELFVVYQPKQDITSGVVVSVEALLRWTSDELGLIMPEEFIPIAEEYLLIGEIGAWVLNQACEQSKQWLDASLRPIQMSVNVSAKQFETGNLVEDINKALTNSGMPATLLDLEITENCLITNMQEVSSQLQTINDKGINITMDDFGTGYSSLSYLSQIPLNSIKIDHSFMRGLPNTKSDVALVTSIISMAHSLDCTVIAEGVENKAQFDLLKRLQCDQIQGFFFSRPIDASLIPAMLSDTLKLDIF